MPRPLRIHFPGALFHVMSRGNARQSIFIEENDWRVFLRLLEEAKARHPFLLYAYCLMPNHFHLLIEACDEPISSAMHLLLTSYTVYFNLRYDRVGHLFQGRYKPILCDREPYLLELLRYIPLNPVRAGLVKNPADWPWSSHRDYLSAHGTGLVDRKFPLSQFHEDESTARQLYEEYVLSSIDRGSNPKLYPASPFLGPDAERRAKMRAPLVSKKAIELMRLCETVAQRTGIQVPVIRSSVRSQPVVIARRMLIGLSIQSGFTQSEISLFLGCGRNAVSKALVSGRS